MLRDLINPHLAAAFSVSEDSPPDPKSTEKHIELLKNCQKIILGSYKVS